MKLAIFSDIHSNDIAFKACIEDAINSNVDGICLLGDYVSDCPNPQATISLIKDLMKTYKVWMVKGNREQYFIDHDDGMEDCWNYSSYKGTLLYTYEHLTNEDIDFIRELPFKSTVDILGTDKLLLVHGSHRHIKELLKPGEDNTKECMDEIDETYVLSGHTHNRARYEYNGKVLINPGSVGVAIGDKGTAHYCILEWQDGRWACEFKNTPYDVDKLKDAFYNSSLIEKAGVWSNCIIKSIEKGINYGPLCSKRAYDYAVVDKVDLQKRNIPEKYWVRAAKDLDVI